MSWRHTIIIFAVLATILPGCSDDPSALNSVGTQLLQTKVVVKSDTLHAVSSSSFRQYISMDGRTNLIGRSGGYTAYTLLHFYPAYIPQRDTVVVVSASLSVRAETWFGDSLASFGFSVHEINRQWGQTTFRWDSLGSGFFNTNAAGTYAGTAARDTQWISVNLADTAMVRRWLRPIALPNSNYGVILFPSPNTNVVRGVHAFEFGSDTLYPRLTVVARNIAGTVTDTTIYKVGQDTFVGNIDNLNSNSELIYAQAGVAYRGLVRFDVSSIPRGAIINQAQLTLTYSRGTSILNRFTSDSTIVAYALQNASDYTKFESVGAVAKSALATANSFVFDIRHQAQEWIRDQSLNYGLVLRTTNTSEFSSFDLFTFYSATAQDSTTRPKLIVTYTVESN